MKPRYTFLLAALVTPLLSWGMLLLCETLFLHFHLFENTSYELPVFILSTFICNLLLVLFTQPKLPLLEFINKFLFAMLLSGIMVFVVIGIFIVYLGLTGYIGC